MAAVWQYDGFSAKLKVSTLKSATWPSCKSIYALFKNDTIKK